jgi:hypothetical protein
MIAYLGLAFTLAAVLYAHRRLPVYRSARARRRGHIGTLIVFVIFGLSWAACGFPKRGPITVQTDGQLISNVEISAPPGIAGINLNGHSWTSIYNVIVAVDNAVYFNLCASSTSASTYNAAALSRADFRSADFVPRPAFKAALCQ